MHETSMNLQLKCGNLRTSNAKVIRRNQGQSRGNMTLNVTGVIPHTTGFYAHVNLPRYTAAT